MKNLVYLFVLSTVSLFSQDRYLTKTGTVSFEASVDTFEEVKANNQAVSAIINTKEGTFAALVLVRAFRFKNALMEEHFNENYAESDQFPKATFKGKIEDFSIEKLETNSSFQANGVLTFHGTSKTLKDLALTVTKKDHIISVSGRFIVKASDFNIKIPKIVRDKINETIKVSLNFNLEL